MLDKRIKVKKEISEEKICWMETNVDEGFIIQGKLIDSKGEKYIGHQVMALYNEKVKIDCTDIEPIWKPSELYANVAEDGTFTLTLPAEDQIRDPIILKVLAPDGEVLLIKEFLIENLKEKITMDVDVKAAFNITSSQDPFLGRRIKITGHIFDVAGKHVSNIQVVLWGRLKGTEPNDFTVVLATQTDKQGYFSDNYPRNEYEEAYGVVANLEQDKIPIKLENKYFPKNVILVVELPEELVELPEKPSDICQVDVPRAPNNEDLINSPTTYSTDLGGGKCVDFTVPNRALEEFSFYTVVRTTDPAIKGLTLTEPPKFSTDIFGQFIEQHRSSTMKMTTSDNPSANKYYINPKVLKGMMLDPDGFTPSTLVKAENLTKFHDVSNLLDIWKKKVPGRGSLTANNPVDWDDEPTFYQATTIAHGHLLHFKQIWKADGYSMGDLIYSLPLAPCQKKQIAIIDWERREFAARSESLQEEERLAAIISRDRDISEIVNSTLTENVRGGSEANTWAAGGGIGLAIGPLVLGGGGGGGGASSSAWQDSSRTLAASSLQQLRDRTMQSASAVRNQRSTVVQTIKQGESMRVQTEVVANHNHCHAITIEYFEVLRHLQVSQELVDVQECLFIPLLLSKFDRSKALRWQESLSRFLRNRPLLRGFGAIERIQSSYEGSDLPTGRYAQETIEYLDGELYMSFKLSRPKDNADGTFDEASWHTFSPFLWTSPSGIFNLYLEKIKQAERDRIFQAEIAPRIAEAFVQSLKFYLIGKNSEFEVKLDPTLVSNFSPNIPLYISLRPAGAIPVVSREWVIRFEIRSNYELPIYSKVVIHSGSVRYRTKHMSHFLFRDARIMNDLMLGDPVQIPTFLDWLELRNPREEDKELAKNIISHLNEHIEYYHKVIWWNMDKDRRYMLLDGFVAPNSNGRSVASVVENRLIGILGNCLIIPVAPGFHLDPTYNQDIEKPIDLLNLYAPIIPIPPMRISVPTRGVYAESVMGACNSCERKDDTRFWRFEESPCGDEPTSIQPISTESRREEPGDLKPTPFPTPMINLQNAPAAPDPTGLAAALKLMGTSGIFKDITGLEMNQKNALAALQSAMETARLFGGEASKLAQQKALVKDMDKTLQTIQQAQKLGLIKEDQANKLTYSALQGMIGEDRKDEKKLIDSTEVKKLLDSTVGTKADVLISRPGETIDIKKSSAASDEKK